MVAPLDWGLGHATRCIPVIRLLLQKGCTVVIAASGAHLRLLQQEFPGIKNLELPGYNIRYGKKSFLWAMLLQLKGIAASIKRENTWLRQAVKDHDIQLVISDNRYGLHHPDICSVLITHQLQVLPPAGFRWTKGIIRHVLYRYINRFTQVWVPDTAGPVNLSGSLGHPNVLPAVPVHYAGWLTRFARQPAPQNFTYACTIVLSGPEPQRSLLEAQLLGQLAFINKKILFIRGLPGAAALPALPDNVTVKNHLSSSDMETAFLQSEYIVSRGGYSTLMDAFTLQKKCIFIPTPGQTEQEYLAQKLRIGNRALVYEQQTFDLQKALETAAQTKFEPVPLPTEALPDTLITNTLKSLHSIQ